MPEELKTKATVKGRYVGGGIFALKEGKDKFSCCTVLNDGEAASVEEIIENAISNKWGDKKKRKSLVIWGVREGDDPDFEASFEGEFINPKNKTMPKILKK